MSSDGGAPYSLSNVTGSFRHGSVLAAEEARMFIPSRPVWMIAAAAVMATGAMFAAPAADDAKLKSAVQTAYTKNLNNKDGKNADYMPALAKVDPKIFGLALVTVDGRVYTAGDMKSE